MVFNVHYSGLMGSIIRRLIRLVSYNGVTIISIAKHAAISFESGFTRCRPLNPANPKISEKPDSD